MNGFSIPYQPPWKRFPDLLHFPSLDDHIVYQVRNSTRFYEADLLEYLYYALPTGGLFVDVGANIGNHTLFFSKYMANRVLAIEPQPDAFSSLQWTVAANHLTNVDSIKCAAGAAKGVGALSLPSKFEGNTGTFTLLPCPTSLRCVEVPVETLDTLLVQLPAASALPVRLLKIDVEGYESEVLEGARGILQSARPDLVVEAHSEHALRSIQRTLSPFGYRVLGCFNATPTYHLSCRNRFGHTRRKIGWKLATLTSRVRRRCELMSLPWKPNR